MREQIITAIIVLICLAIAWAIIHQAPIIDATIKWGLIALSGLLAILFLLGWI